MQSTLVATIPLLPLAGFLLLGLLGKYIPNRLTGIVASTTILVSFVSGLILYFDLQSGSGQAIQVKLMEWISFSRIQIDFSLLVDPLSALMILIITGVGFLIHVYSIGYMHDDKGFARFFSYMNLFVFFMLVLVMSDNYLLMFAGWEGVGLCSYLLIGFWFKNHEYNDAANKAFIMNRIGDLGFLLGLFFIFYLFGSLNYDVVFGSIAQTPPPVDIVTLICLLLFVGAIGKSAQLPLFTWLPDAMAGPTPVSALIHAATMVTAGVYLIVRNSVLFSISPIAMNVIAITGITTSLFAATIALKQNDIKKILAYSTVSQLGLMIFAAGLGAFTAAMFHLTTHAFFKALLFLGAGSVIHALHGEQDIRNMGGLQKKLPVTFITFLAGTIAISGIPPFSGFFSKDEILLSAYNVNPIYWFLGIVVSIFTAYYMFRLFFLTFFSQFRGDQHSWDKAHESPGVMWIPLAILAILAVFGGIMNLPELVGGHQALHHFLGFDHSMGNHVSHLTEWFLIGITTTVILIVVWFANRQFRIKPFAYSEPRGFSELISNKFYVDEIYQSLIVNPLFKLAGFLWNIFERYIIDLLVEGTGKILQTSSAIVRKVQNGQVSVYLLFMVLGMVLLLSINLLL